MAINLGILLGESGRIEDSVAALRHGATLAARLGDAGQALAARAEAAIAAAREAEMARPTAAPDETLIPPTDGDHADAVYRETTLPPA